MSNPTSKDASRNSPKLKNLKWLAVLCLLLAVAFSAWKTFGPGSPTASDVAAEAGSGKSVSNLSVPDSDVAAIRGIVSSEEVILALSPKLNDVTQSVLNLKMTAGETFADSLVVHDLLNESDGKWKAGKSETRSRGAEIWSALMKEVSYFDHAKFKIVRGDFKDNTTFETLASFSGRARMKSGKLAGMNGELTITWEQGRLSLRESSVKRISRLGVSPGSEVVSDSQPGLTPKRLMNSQSLRESSALSRSERRQWRIANWKTQTFDVNLSDEMWFHESLAEALPRSGDLQALRRSQHHEETIEFYTEGRKRIPHRYFATISANQKPGIAVADIDSDGDDDIFVAVRRGYCKLLENQGDGTFIENAVGRGLNVKNHCTSALFADFDNDGDADLMLGRSLLPTIYFVNEGEKFRPIKPTNMPRLTISMSAADYDQDGLLDVYACTYRPAMLGGSSPAGGVEADSKTWPDEFLPPDTAKQYYKRHAESRNSDPNNAFPNLLNQIGPPNVLLRNLGNGQFAHVELPPEFDVWKNSLQATWSDYDEDGDPDLYIANDWAPDHLFRNDGSQGGSPTFTDVTQEAGTTKFGFAMGASWGDYDNDGDRDLYVTNMFSKAGMRITAQVNGLDPDYQESATGNYLYQQQPDGTFDLVSGLKPPKLLVAKAGWAWGGQFADFNNDGWLDIYSMNGYFSAPKEVATQMDL